MQENVFISYKILCVCYHKILCASVLNFRAFIQTGITVQGSNLNYLGSVQHWFSNPLC